MEGSNNADGAPKSTTSRSSSSTPTPKSPAAKKSGVIPSKVSILFHKMKKAFKVDKTTTLPADVQNNYSYVKSYRDELFHLSEAIRSVVLPDPHEVQRVAAWDLAQEERDHQKTTSKIFVDVTRFLAVDYPILEQAMRGLLDSRDAMDYKMAQKVSNTIDSKRIADEIAEAKKLFKSLCVKVNIMTKEMMKLTEKHAHTLPAWVDMRLVYHMKMEKILANAGIE